MKVDYTGLNNRLKKVKEVLVPFQVGVISFAKTNKRIIIESDMGTGKTLMALTAMFLEQREKVIIVCSKNALYTWQKEIKKWYPEWSGSKFYTVVSANKKKREVLWAKDSLFYVCTYQTLMRDESIVSKMGFKILIGDECHRGGLRNRKSKGFKCIKNITKNIPNIYFLTGTLSRKGPQDVWGLLNILDRKMFRSYWKFINTYCLVIDGPFGKEILGGKNIEGFSMITAPYIYKVPKSISDAQLPKLTRVFIPVEMTSTQARWYKKMCEDMMVEFDSNEIVIASNILTSLTRLRQITCCPAMLNDDMNDLGAGIETVVDMIQDMETHHCVVFTPYRKAVTYFKQYLKDKVTKDVFHLWGSMEPEEVGAAVEGFKKTGGIIVCTVKFSQSFELETANKCFFIGYEHDQNENYQSEGRLRRMTVDKPIKAYYLQHKNPYEPNEMVDNKILEAMQGRSMDAHILHNLGINTRNVNIMNKHVVERIEKRIANMDNKKNQKDN